MSNVGEGNRSVSCLASASFYGDRRAFRGTLVTTTFQAGRIATTASCQYTNSNSTSMTLLF